MEHSTRIVTVFGSAFPQPGEPEYLHALEVGRALGAAGFTVCNGGYGGVMEASARGAKESGGRTVGIVAEAFTSRAPNRWIDSVVTVKSMPDRMFALIERGDAYVVLKGGTGTLLELAAVWEFMNKELMKVKPIVIVGDAWDEVVGSVREQLVQEGRAGVAQYVTVVRTPAECAEVITGKFASGSSVDGR